MAARYEYEDADEKKLPPTTPAMKPYDAALDPSDPLRFLDKAFEFLAMESDMFDIDSLDKMEKVKIEGDGKAKRNTEKEVPPVKNEETTEVAKSEIKVEEEKDGLRVPNKGNGLDMENYSWGQTSQYVDIHIPVPPRTMTRDITWEIRKDRIKFGLKGQPLVLDGELCKPINFIHSFWVLGEKNRVSIYLRKQDTTQKDWWKYIVKGEPKIDIQKVKPEETNLRNVDPEAQAAVEKLVREKMLKKYEAKHPGMTMDF